MKIIRTVLADLSPDPLFSHCHEHIWIGKQSLGDQCPVSAIDDEAASLAELKSFYEAGGRLLADAQPTGAGGSPSKLAELSRASGVSIIASTGFHKLCFYRTDSPIHILTAEELTASFCRDIRDKHCGMIKVAADRNWLEGRNELLHHAAAVAAGSTGTPVLCHVEQGADPIAILVFIQKRVLPPIPSFSVTVTGRFPNLDGIWQQSKREPIWSMIPSHVLSTIAMRSRSD